MLINVKGDRAFQRFLDHWEQRLHLQMAPLLYRGIRLQMREGGVNAHDMIVKRGKPILVRHYTRIFREVYKSVEPIEKDSGGIGAFMDRMLGYLDSEGAKRIQFISQGLMDAIRDGIMDGVRQGLSNQEITADILEEAPDMARYRAATIARTETHGAATWAMDETIDEKEIEIVTKTWWTAGDARVRASHAAMHGVEIARDELFELDGGSMGYPGDDSQGADEGEIINCRCVCLYSTGSEFEKGSEDQPRVPAGSPEGGQWTSNGGGGGTSKPEPSTNQPSISQRDSIATYAEGATSINRDLREGNITDQDVAKDIANLDSFLSRQSLPADQTAFRGVSGDRFVRALNRMKRGEMLEDKAFLSTSISEQAAKEYTSRGGKGALMKISLPKGSRAVDISKFARGPLQHLAADKEILVARNSKLRFDGLSAVPGQKYYNFTLMKH